MKNSISKTKMTVAIVLVLLMASALLLGIPVQAQYTNVQDRGSVPLPSGVTPDASYDTIAHMSFRPNPIGLGQPLLVNLWLQPPIHVSHYIKQAYLVTFTKPNGTTDTIGPMDSYQGDTTAWFEYVVDQVGTWKIKFDFLGGYFPAGNYTVVGYYAGQVLNAPLSIYYKPSSDGPYEFVVQQDMVGSWPPSPLPTDYWTRPVSPENREWWSILGNYPSTGIVAGVGRGVTLADWPADTNKYMSNYNFIPYVQAPKSAHVVWKRQGAYGGLLGGTMGITSSTSGGGGPTMVYAGRAYQTITKIVDGTSTSVWQCYDLRTGEVYWERYPATQVPTMIMYSERELDVVPGEAASASMRIELMYVGGGRLITYNPWTGTVSMNFSIAPLTTGTYYASYDWPYFLTVQSLSGKYYLINWTVAGDPSGFGLGNFRLEVLNNVTWPFSSLGIVDYEAGIAVNTEGITPPGVGVAYGQRIMAASITTGQLLWNVTTATSTGVGGFFSGSTRVADHGKFAVRLNDGHFHCWDLYSGKELWVSELTSWPWGIWGPYSIASAYGMIIYGQYDGVAAYDWNTGKVAWHYVYEAPYPYESPYTGPEGETVMPFRSTAVIADGKVYVANAEHSTSQPLTRGWKLHCINATTGEGIWNITGSMSAGAISDGYLTASSSYFGYMYVFGKGKSATTVTASDKTIAKGASVLIEGTVLDQSPAQPGTPCVSKDSMATYMEYLHMQKPIPSGYMVTGVPVKLLAIDVTGNVIDIGTVTSDVSGSFKAAWTPPNEGLYTITANFAGDESYGSSWAETGLSVGPAPTPINIPEAPTPADYTWTIVGMGIAIIIAVALVGALILMKKH